jgi:two-component system LytT family response regulator
MERIRAIVVDDEPLARERLCDLLRSDAEVDVVAVCADGVEAVAAVRDLSPDLCFLDVQMPESGGFDVVTEIGVDRMPVVIFVTAYDHHALRAFEAHALDYLLKPFDEARFRAALERAKTHVRNARAASLGERLASLVEELRPQREHLDRVAVRSSGRLVLLKWTEIDWIAAEGNYVRLHAGDASHLLRETIGALEARLDPRQFMRIHRSTIVNLDRVREVQPLFHGEHRVVLDDGTKLTLSRGYRDRLSRFERA